MSKFYTNISVQGNQILERGYENGVPFKSRSPWNPTYYVPAGEDKASWSGLYGEKLAPVKMGSILEARGFLKQYRDSSMPIHGDIGFDYQYIAAKYPSDIPYVGSDINTVFIDIETTAENGFPKISEASETITVITCKSSKEEKYHTWSLLPFNGLMPPDVDIKTFNGDEKALLRDFVNWWTGIGPDIITGWNSEIFDIPYLMNRLTNVFGESFASNMSPWKKISSRDKQISTHIDTIFKLDGIAQLDLLSLYKKFTYSAQESYKLDYIAEVEIGAKKLENPEPNFRDFYRKHWDTFVLYNINDVRLCVGIDAKMKLVDLALAVAYLAKVNLDDVFYQTVMWDSIIYNHLLPRHIAIPPRPSVPARQGYEGAYVMEPEPRMYHWIVNGDFDSLYPHLIMQYNISPETMLDDCISDCSVQGMLNDKVDLSKLKPTNATCTPNGVMFTRTILGIIPELMASMYDNRKIAKKQMLEAEKMVEQTTGAEQRKWKNEVARFKNLQLALKVGLNSAYGTMGTPSFRYYDLRLAEGITLAGQLSLLWAARHINIYMNKALKTKDKNIVVYGDTDSVYMEMEAIVNMMYPNHTTLETVDWLDKLFDKVVEPFLAKTMGELAEYTNAYAQKMHMKRESIADKGIWVAKKHYVLRVWDSEHVRFAEPHIKIMGLQMIKSSTPSALRKVLRKAIPVILDGGEEALQKFVADFRIEFDKMPLEDIAFPTSVNGMGIYAGSPIYTKGTPIHVRAALLHNHMAKRLKLMDEIQMIRNGDRIWYTYLLMPNPIHENVIAFSGKFPDEFKLRPYVDYDMQFNRAFLKPLETVVKHLGWTAQKVSSLEAFF